MFGLFVVEVVPRIKEFEQPKRPCSGVSVAPGVLCLESTQWLTVASLMIGIYQHAPHENTLEASSYVVSFPSMF